jgi:hypothetical protein
VSSLETIRRGPEIDLQTIDLVRIEQLGVPPMIAIGSAKNSCRQGVVFLLAGYRQRLNTRSDFP